MPTLPSWRGSQPCQASKPTGFGQTNPVSPPAEPSARESFCPHRLLLQHRVCAWAKTVQPSARRDPEQLGSHPPSLPSRLRPPTHSVRPTHAMRAFGQGQFSRAWLSDWCRVGCGSGPSKRLASQHGGTPVIRATKPDSRRTVAPLGQAREN